MYKNRRLGLTRVVLCLGKVDVTWFDVYMHRSKRWYVSNEGLGVCLTLLYTYIYFKNKLELPWRIPLDSFYCALLLYLVARRCIFKRHFIVVLSECQDSFLNYEL
ncbi:hypothetical protein F4703DRAFT_1866286 [Phycomyces blakesleeanus]